LDKTLLNYPDLREIVKAYLKLPEDAQTAFKKLIETNKAEKE
jgi:hypothetical protein